MKAILSVAAPLLAGLALSLQPLDDEVEGLVEAYCAQDGRTEESRAARDEALEAIDALEPLTAKEAKTWAAEFAKRRKQLPKLEKRGSALHSYYAPGDCRYMLGGNTKSPSSVLIALHGSGGYGAKIQGMVGKYGSAASSSDSVLLLPSMPNKSVFWTDEQYEIFVFDLLEAALRTWRVDPDRVTVVGFSGGSIGTWMLGAYHADRFAMISPAGGGPFAGAIQSGMIPNLRNAHMKIHQFEEDPRTPSEPVREAVELMTEARERWGGYDFEYLETPGRGHGEPEGGMGRWIRNLPEVEREGRPERVVWQPARAWKRQFHWLYYDGPLPGPVIVADLDAEQNEVRLQVEGDAAGLSVLLDDRLLDLDEPLTVRLGERVIFQGKLQPSLGAMVRTHLSADSALHFEALVEVDGTP